MSKIMNIGSLDVREIKEELAKEISELANIGILMESNESQLLLKNCKKINIGATLKIPSDLNVKVITSNGKMKVDKEYLEGFKDPVVILVNGSLTFAQDINVQLIEEKIFSIMVNGSLVCPKKLAGAINTKGIINGICYTYKSEYMFYEDTVRLTNKFLKSLKPNSKLTFNRLLILEDIDKKTLEEKVSNIEILDKVLIVEEYEDMISQYIDDYYAVNSMIVPNGTNGVKYIEDTFLIDESTIARFRKNVLVVDGEVEVFLKDIVFSDYIEHLICDKLICDEITYEIIKNNIDKDIKVDIIRGKLLKNNGKMVLSDNFEEQTTILNMGKLILSETLNYENFNEKVEAITNYGKIVIQKDKLGLLEAKLKDNFGKISTNEDTDVVEQSNEGIMYSNIGELKL